MLPPVQTPGKRPAFEVARLTFEQWARRDGIARTFEEELADHCRNGFVQILPEQFLLAKAVQLPDGRLAWDITHAIGDLPLLMAAMPFPLDWIAFQRNHGSARLSVYPLERFAELALRFQGRRQKSEGRTASTS